MSGEADRMREALAAPRDQIGEFMRADIDWIDPEEYHREYHRLMGENIMDQAAFTKRPVVDQPLALYPDYVNARFTPEGKLALVVRGDPNQTSTGTAPGAVPPVAMIVMDVEDWDQFIASTRMLRRPDPAQPDLPIEDTAEFSGYAEMLPEHAEPGGTEIEHPEPQPLRDDDLSGALPAKFFDEHPEGADQSGGATAADPLNQRGGEPDRTGLPKPDA